MTTGNKKQAALKKSSSKDSKPVDLNSTLANSRKAQSKLENLLGLIIALFAFLLYVQSISFDYTLDDATVTKQNAVVTKGLAGIPTIIKTDYWHGLSSEVKVPEYRPLPLVLMALEWQFFPNNPHAGHLVNVLMYSITCWLLFRLLCKLFKNKNLVLPFACALIYTAHPVHTEVTDSIKSCDEILCFLFALLSISLLAGYIEKKSTLKLVLAMMCYFFSLLSKETGIAFLIIIPMTLFVFSNAAYKKLLNIGLLMACLTGLFLLIRYEVLRSISTTALKDPINNSLFAAPGFWSEKATVFYILLRYILLLLFPYPLSYDYSFDQLPVQTIGNPAVIIALILYFGMGIYAVFEIQKKSYIAFAILFFLFTLAPVSNLFLLIGAPMAERFMYMPSFGFCLLAALLVIRLTKTDLLKNKYTGFRQLLSVNSSAFLIIFVLTIIYSAGTIARNSVWKNNASLFSNDVQHVENSARAHYNWATCILTDLVPKEVNGARRKELMNTAKEELNKAIAIYGFYPDAYNNLGICYKNLKEYDEGIRALEGFCKVYKKPDGNIFVDLASLYSAKNENDKALSYIDSAIKYGPRNALFYYDEGDIIYETGNYTAAIASYQKAIDLEPSYSMAYMRIGFSYLNMHSYDAAIHSSEEAIRIDPADAMAYCCIGGAYCNLAQYDKAIEYLTKAAELDPSSALPVRFLGIAYKRIGDQARANECFEREKMLENDGM